MITEPTALIVIGELANTSNVRVSSHCLTEIILALCNEVEMLEAGIHGNKDLNERARLMKDSIGLIESIEKLEKLRDAVESLISI